MSVVSSSIPFEVQSVLAASTVHESVVKLPPDLERSLYLSVDKVLQDLGGKWNRGKKGHVFASPAAAANVREAAETGMVVSPRVNGYFPTPEPVITTMMAYGVVTPEAFEPGACPRFLEPSAGAGAICAQLRRRVPWSEIVTYELLPENRGRLAATGFDVQGDDFLDARPEHFNHLFDRIIMNPPFAHYVEHINHAIDFLKPGGRLVAVAPAGLTFRNDRRIRELRERMCGINDLITPLPDGAFKPSGTMVRTVLVLHCKPNI